MGIEVQYVSDEHVQWELRFNVSVMPEHVQWALRFNMSVMRMFSGN